MLQLARSGGRSGRGYWARLALGAFVAAGLALPNPAIAQAPSPPGADFQPTDQNQQPDPPARVGRLSYLTGTVSFRTLDDDQWDTAVVNYPVTGGLGFWTEPNARATLQLGHGAVRMESSTEVDVQQFDDQVIQIAVPQGSINFRLRSLAPGETYRIVTPTGAVQLNRPGRYDITVVADGSPAKVSVLEGSADIIGENGTVTVNAGAVGSIAPVPPPPAPAMAQPQPIDTFSDQQEAAMAQVPGYLSPDMPGIQDVVSTGDWGSSPDYGQVWYPPVQPGWAPYRYGHWAFVAPWGWTWIDDAPWGFAPFHYGRWVEIGPRWAWVPGPVAPQPVYAPALVAFVGGAALAVSFGVGPVVGWIPLGPHEIYYPPYGGSINYVRHVNVTNVTNVNVINYNTINNYRTQSADHFMNARGATVVRSNAMTSSAPIRNSSLAVDPSRFHGVNVASSAPVRPNLGTKGVSQNIVQAAGGSTSAGGGKRYRAPGPKGGTTIYTPTSASSKSTGTKGFTTFTPPGGVKSFVPAAGAGSSTGAGSGAKGSGPSNVKTFNPQGSGGSGSAAGSKGGGTGGASGSQSTVTEGGKKYRAPSGGGTGSATGSTSTGGSGTGSAGGSKSTGAAGARTYTPPGGTGGSGKAGAKTYVPPGGSGTGTTTGSSSTGTTGAKKYRAPSGGGTGTTTGSTSTGAGGSKSSGTGGAKTNAQSGTGGASDQNSGGQTSGGSKTGSGTTNGNGNKSGSPPPCNPPHHVVNGKCV